MSRSRYIAAAALVAGVAAFLHFRPSLSIGAAAPDVRMQEATGRTIRMSHYRGQVVVLDFWASWCSASRDTVPAMERLHDRFARRGVAVFGVNFKEHEDPVSALSGFGGTYPVILRGEETAAAFGVHGVPAFVVVGVDGRVLYRNSGWARHHEQKIAEVIDRHLSENGM